MDVHATTPNRLVIQRRPSDAELIERLHSRGVARHAAEELVAEHPARRVMDALDALDEIDQGRVRSPAGWLVSAVRDNWDLTEVLAERRQSEARLARWEREQLERDDADLIAHRRQARSRTWYSAISGALDDTQLETAVDRVTTPVTGLGRRSVPLARAQLVAWAVDVRRQEPEAPFDKALRADLEAEPHPVVTIGGTLPPSPCAAPDAPDADLVVQHLRAPVTRVAVDGIDGAGKTTFADELAGVLRDRGRPVIRASVDGFHHPRQIRYRRGRGSSVGYYLDSFDYDRLRRVLLDPLSPGGIGSYVPAVHDVGSNQTVDLEPEQAADGSVLVFDGIFLHRPELVDYWDCSIFLKVDRPIAVERMRRRDGAVDVTLERPRYAEGQRLYLETSRPDELATVVVDNDVLDEPKLLR